MIDLDTLVGRLLELETRYFDLLDRYQSLINDYESLKDKYETNRNRPGSSDGSLKDSSNQDD